MASLYGNILRFRGEIDALETLYRNGDIDIHAYSSRKSPAMRAISDKIARYAEKYRILGTALNEKMTFGYERPLLRAVRDYTGGSEMFLPGTDTNKTRKASRELRKILGISRPLEKPFWPRSSKKMYNAAMERDVKKIRDRASFIDDHMSKYIDSMGDSFS